MKLSTISIAALTALAAAFWAVGPAAASANIVPLMGVGYIDLSTGVTGASVAEVAAKEAGSIDAGDADVVTPATGTEAGTGTAPTVDAPADASATDTAVFTPASFPLKDAVIRARALLEARIQEQAAQLKKPRTVATTSTPVDVTIAVWHSLTDTIQLVDMVKSGTKVKFDDDKADFGVSVRRSNGVNSEFVLAGADDSYVVAIQAPIYKEVWLTKSKKAYQLTDVVYSPYAQKLHTDEVVAWGRDTLDQYVRDVYDRLRADGVKSRAFPDRLLADVIDPDLAKAVILIEHLSPQAMQKDLAGASESVLVTMALNQDDTYAYSRSSAGAKGLVQFIPSTYKLIAKRSELKLDPNFETGMADPLNAIRAEVAYLDAELASMPLAVKDLMSVDPLKAGEYLAAAYNGGGARVRKALKAWGETWSENHAADVARLTAENKQLLAKIKALQAEAKKAPTAKAAQKLKDEAYLNSKRQAAVSAQLAASKTASLRAETVDYVKKLRWALSYLKPPPPPTSAS